MNAIWPIEKILHTFEKRVGSRKITFHTMEIFNIFEITRWKQIFYVRHVFIYSLRLKHRMRLILRVLDIPGLVDYFLYPHHGQKVRKKCLEPFEGKNFPQKWGKSEISRWSNQLENVIFRLPTFFSKVSKFFSIGHIAFIFPLRCVFIFIWDPWKIWRAYDKTSGKYLGKHTPPDRDLGGSASILHL